jgi:thiosulfate/3-mercaptopyruvate sulfurtransferase
VLAGLDDPARVLVDARAEPRFRGESETLDRKAGHIPGARSFFFQRNLADDRTFKSPTEIRDEWASVLGATTPEQVVMYCGSGVTACHNLLALEHAGLPGARLYPGSWSEWSSDPNRPIETG